MKNNYLTFKFERNDYLILRTVKTFERTESGKSWKSQPSEVEQEIVNSKRFTNYVQAIPFFNRFGYGAYCRAKNTLEAFGSVPTIITTVSPYKETKKEAVFDFIKIDKLKKNAGWREAFIVDNAKYFEIFYNNNKKYLELITGEEGSVYSGVVDLSSFVWVN